MIKCPLSVIVLTFNDESNIEKCLKSVTNWASEIFIVDSYSNDQTLKKVNDYTKNVFQHAFEGHAKQWNWALDNLNINNDWVLALDSDFILTEALKKEIYYEIIKPNNVFNGYYMNRRYIFRGAWIKHGGYYPKYWLRLFKRQTARCDEEEFLDLRFYVNGSVKKLHNDFIEDNNKERDLNFWLGKHIRFAAIQAREEFVRRTANQKWKTKPSLFGDPYQKILYLKSIWYKLPLFIRPFLYFFYRYFIRLGFLDGYNGLILHFFQGFWYRFLVDAMIYELEKH